MWLIDSLIPRFRRNSSLHGSPRSAVHLSLPHLHLSLPHSNLSLPRSAVHLSRSALHRSPLPHSAVPRSSLRAPLVLTDTSTSTARDFRDKRQLSPKQARGLRLVRQLLLQFRQFRFQFRQSLLFLSQVLVLRKCGRILRRRWIIWCPGHGTQCSLRSGYIVRQRQRAFHNIRFREWPRISQRDPTIVFILFVGEELLIHVRSQNLLELGSERILVVRQLIHLFKMLSSLRDRPFVGLPELAVLLHEIIVDKLCRSLRRMVHDSAA